MEHNRLVLFLVFAGVFGLVATTALPVASAGITDFSLSIDNYKQNPAQGEEFPVVVTANKPDDISIPDISNKHCTIYYMAFWFDKQDHIHYPAKGYWWSKGGEKYQGSKFYNSYTSTYTLNVKMKDNAKVGQEFFLGAYWKIPLQKEYQLSGSGEVGDQVQVQLANNSYTLTVQSVDTYPNYTKYYLAEGQTRDIYVRTDDQGYLYVRTLKHGLTVKPSGGGGGALALPLAAKVGIGIVIAVVVIGIAVVKRRGGEEVPA